LGIVCTRLGDVIREQGRVRESIPWYERAQTELRASLSNNKSDTNASFHLFLTHSGLGRAAAATNDHATAARESEALADEAGGHDSGELTFDAAIIMARARQAVQSDDLLDAEARQQLSEKYAARAAQMLEVCRANGLFGDPYFRRIFHECPEFRLLEDRAELAPLLEELQKLEMAEPDATSSTP
jgi:hypothetical protein